jgi:cytidylate kinase
MANFVLYLHIMKIFLLYKGKDIPLQTVSEDVLSEDDIYEFSVSTGVSKLGTGELIKLFDYFYKIDINDYSFHKLVVSDNCITLYLSKEDYNRIIRDKKINNLLNI